MKEVVKGPESAKVYMGLWFHTPQRLMVDVAMNLRGTTRYNARRRKLTSLSSGCGYGSVSRASCKNDEADPTWGWVRC